jgi:ATP/maltotriose-dependent transcriptional regulator MalT
MVQIEFGEGRVVQEHADAGVALANEHGFLSNVALGTVLRGEALIAQEQWAEGIDQVRQGLEAQEGELTRTLSLAWLAEGYGRAGQINEGLAAVAEALRLVDKNDERCYEAELYRIKGELTLQGANQKAKGKRQKAKIGTSPQPLIPNTQAEVEQEAEECFLKAIDIARKQ